MEKLLSPVKYWYLQWELASSLYMMEPAEKIAIHFVLVLLISMLLLAGYYSTIDYMHVIVLYIKALAGISTENEQFIPQTGT